MSDKRDPEYDQAAPVPNDSVPIADLVIMDLYRRKAMGIKKYGVPLQANNGRSFLLDAYYELLDLLMYLRGRLEEEGIEVK